MKCFFCGHSKTIVLNSRGREDFSKIVRRRCCPKCQKRATTFEVISDHKNKKNITLIAHYDFILQQLHSLEKSIQKLHNVFFS